MTHSKETPHIKKPLTAPPTRSCFHDLDFWRLVLAALSLAWEIVKTWVR